MQFLSWIGFTIGVLMMLFGFIFLNRIFKKEREEDRKPQKKIISFLLEFVWFLVLFASLVGGMLFIVFVGTGTQQDMIPVTFKDGKAIAIEPKEGYTVLFDEGFVQKRTLKNPRIEQMDLDIQSKEGREFSITLSIHSYFVKEEKQLKEKINGATKKELLEDVDQKELIKMIQQEVRTYTAEELNSKLFLSGLLKHVEVDYNQHHFLQIKLFS